MRILGLWVVEYKTGSNSERFVEPIKRLGHTIDVIPIESKDLHEQLFKKAKDYDLLLHAPHANFVQPEIIAHVSKKIKTVSWNGDDEWKFQCEPWHQELIKAHTWCVTTDPNAVSKYEWMGYKNVILKSWGFSKEWNKRWVKKSIPCYFCGSKNDDRDFYILPSIRKSIPLFVEGWGYSAKVEFKEMVQKYRMAKIGINFIKGTNKGFGYFQIKARCFEICAVGTFQLCEHSDSLRHYFEIGKEIDTFSNLDEFHDKLAYYFNHDRERENIAKRGHQRVQEYSYDNIFKDIFRRIK